MSSFRYRTVITINSKQYKLQEYEMNVYCEWVEVEKNETQS